MIKIKSITFLIVMSFISFLFITSCEWEKYNPDLIEVENVSFSKDIIPIFNQSCNTIGCHSENGVAPDLSPVNAYQNLKDKNMIDLASPENSELYIRMTDVKNPMPLSGILSGKTVKTILVWIEEGAQNN